MRIRFHTRAESDITDAIDWYLERDAIVAEQFADAVDAAVSKIADNHKRFPFWDARHQFLLMRRFPFYVAFRVEADFVIIVAVRHTSLDGDKWTQRDPIA